MPFLKYLNVVLRVDFLSVGEFVGCLLGFERCAVGILPSVRAIRVRVLVRLQDFGTGWARKAGVGLRDAVLPGVLPAAFSCILISHSLSLSFSLFLSLYLPKPSLILFCWVMKKNLTTIIFNSTKIFYYLATQRTLHNPDYCFSCGFGDSNPKLDSKWFESIFCHMD